MSVHWKRNELQTWAEMQLKERDNSEESAPHLTHFHDLNPLKQINYGVINFASDNYIFYYRILSKGRCATLSEGPPIKLFVSVCLFN